MQGQEEVSAGENTQDQEKWSGKRAKLIIPREAFYLAEKHRLGKPTAYYRSQHKGKKRWYAFCAAGFFLLVDALVILELLTDGKIISTVIFGSCLFAISCFVCYNAIKRRCIEASAMAYFCQLGFIYKESKRLVVLHWEEIEQVGRGPDWFRKCEVMLGNGEKIALVDAVGGNLREQIRRRLLRARKKHQHGEAFYYRE